MVKKQAPQVEVEIQYVRADKFPAENLNPTDSTLEGAKLKVSVDAGTTKIDTSDLLTNNKNYVVTEWLGTTKVENGVVKNGIATVYIMSK